MGGGGGLKIFFQPFEPQFGLKIRGEPGPRAPPLDPPQFKASRTFFEVGFSLLICKRTSTGYPHDVVTCRSRRWLVLVVFTTSHRHWGEYQNICGTKFSRYLFSARSEFGIFIVFFNEVFSSYVIRVNCVSYISCCQSVCSSFGSATPHATTLFFLTWVTRRTAMFVLVRTLKS